MKTTLLIFLLLYSILTSFSQTFNKGHLSIISTTQIIPENYFVIKLPPEMVTDTKANLFNVETALNCVIKRVEYCSN